MSPIKNIEFCQDFDPRDSQLRRFWRFEAMGITDTDTALRSIKDTAMLSNFSHSFRIEDGLAVVSQPKKEIAIPADKHTNAQRRYLFLTNRIATTTDFRTMYESKMLNYTLQHQFEVAPPGSSEASKFYMPRHVVKKEKSKAVKWRNFLGPISMSRDTHPWMTPLKWGPTAFRKSSVSSFH